MNVCKTGLNKLHAFILQAPGDIRHRLWSFYWLARMTHTPGGCMVELGTRGGDSTRALLCAAEDLDAHLFSFDIEDCSHVITDPVLREHWSFRVQDSTHAGVTWNKQVDLIFCDTDHTLQTTSKEIAVWSNHLHSGGAFIFHDYWLGDPPRDGVKPAVDRFVDFNCSQWTLETWDRGPDGDTGGAVMWKEMRRGVVR